MEGSQQEATPNSSFVDSSPEKEADLSSNDGPIMPIPSIPQSPSYISSASSTTGATTPFTPMDTINNTPRKASDDAMHVPPVNPFFNPYVYDSDGSDGSFVLSYKPKKNKKGQAKVTGENRRDRLPSFDSAASTGSVRYVSSSHASPVPQPQQPVNPQLLPYHERRKLAQKRQQQQQQQLRNKQNQPQIQPPRTIDTRNMQQPHFPPMMMPQQPNHLQHAPPPFPPMDPMAAAAAYHGMYGMPVPGFQQAYPPPYPPPGQFPHQPPGPPGQVPFMHPIPGYPPPPFPYHHMPTPSGGYPQSQSQPQSQPQQQSQTHSQPQAHPHLQLQSQAQQPHAQQPQQQHQPPQHPPQFAQPIQSGESIQSHQKLSPYRTIGKQERPPKGIAIGQNIPVKAGRSPRPPMSNKAGIPRPHLSSVDSSDNSPPKQQNNRQQTNSSDAPPPPPPPPPPPLSQYHVRTDSAGSLSSLGSAGPGNEKETEERNRRGHNRTLSSGSGLMDMLRKWSPKESESEKGTVSDFHRKNQEFLQRSNPNRSGGGARAAPLPAPPQQNHRRVGSQDRPPASRGTHKRLPSITNDDWDENGGPRSHETEQNTAGNGDNSSYSNSDVTDDEREQLVNERTSLLPPSGISTNEQEGNNRRSNRRNRKESRQKIAARSEEKAGTDKINNRTNLEKSFKSSRKQRKKKHKSRRKSSRYMSTNQDTSDSDSSYDYRKWTKKRARMLEKERAKLVEQWKAEARAEAEVARREAERNRWHRRAGRSLWNQLLILKARFFRLFTLIEAFIANLPLTLGAIAMAVVTLGVVWFKFAEENLDSCEPVHFHSSQCTFPEFPGCFYCDTTARMYKVAIYFHYGCKITSGLMAMVFVAKVLLATRIVVDEMSSPTTASPAGLLCMTTVCVFAGRGLIGQIMVTIAACVHLGLVVWFIYMALAYHIMPDPSWFPNTVGVGLSAVKTWLYYPMPGHLLMAISLSLNFFFFPISLIRVAINEKISATVGWMQMSAPAISLYALTIMAQPSFEEEHPDVTRFQRVHRMVYLPCMHVMAALSILGFFASIHSLWNRWSDFKKKEFSPAHAAFCFPILSHVNAIQAYRGAIISFSDIHPRSAKMVVLYTYWLILLVGGTIGTFWITAKFLYSLPKWTNIDLSDEEEPPAPYETVMSQMLTSGETLRQHFVSPAVLQANETGALVMARNAEDGQVRYVRTRRLQALGFEPTMNWSEMQEERDVLLEWAEKHPPRRRHRTLSVPGIDFNYGSNLGTGNSGVYGAYGISPLQGTRKRADTGSPRSYY